MGFQPGALGLDRHHVLAHDLRPAEGLVFVDLLLEVLEDYYSGASLLEILPKFFGILLPTITNPKCRKVLQKGEKWLSQKDFWRFLKN